MAHAKKSFFRRRIPEFILVILLVASGVLMSFNSGGFVVNFKQVGFNIFSSCENAVSKVTISVSNTFLAVKNLAKLHQEYEELTEKLKDYEYMQRTNSDIRKENARLKEQLGFAQNLEYKNYPAQIISRGADNLYSTITVNKGSKDGIRKNMPVIAIQQGNIGIVGKVVSVGRFTSEVMPLFDFSCSISARVQNTRDVGLVTGNGSEQMPLSLKYIKKSARERVMGEGSLRFGDVIVTSGENENYMADIPIGTISKIAVLDYDTSLEIELTPIIDFSRLENVVIVEQHEKNDRAVEAESD